MTNKELADWLEENLDSHGIYDAEMLTQLDPQDAAVVPTQSREEVRQAIIARGLGGNLADEGPEPLFTGYVAAEAVTRRRLGELPEGVLRVQGRGTIHRMCIAALRDTPDVEQEDRIQRFPHEVLGHWRNLPNGERKWIPPHVRGPVTIEEAE